MRSTSLIYWFCTSLVGACLCGLVFSTAMADEEVLAVVNEAKITRQDLEEEKSLLEAEMRHRSTPLSDSKLDRMKRQLVENLIERELLYQRAQQRELKIRPQWVDRAMLDLKDELKTRSGYRAYLEDANISQEQLKSRIRKGLIVRRLLRRDVIRQIKVSEAEMQAFYRSNTEFFQRREQIRVRHIMVAFDSQGEQASRSEARRRIQSIQDKVKQGGNFAALALDHSEDNSRTSGGDLGYLHRDQMIPAFADAAFSLKPGQISDIVETHLGYHLIQLVDRVPSSHLAYRNARTKIERTLRRNKEKKATDDYLAKLKRQASISRLHRF